MTAFFLWKRTNTSANRARAVVAARSDYVSGASLSDRESRVKPLSRDAFSHFQMA